MSVGPKIKEFRTKAGLTQKELADELHVTYQAVSRWENEDAEPSFDVIKELCGIFHCSTDDLFEIQKPDESKEENIRVVERVIVQESKPVLAVCEKCNSPIYDANDLNRINETYTVRDGRSWHNETRQKILCNDCNEKRLLEIRKEKAFQEALRLDEIKRRRIKAFIWPSIIMTLFIVVGISSFTKGDTKLGIECIVTAIIAYTFSATMILKNTFLTDMWLEITSWGFVRMPGVIFSFSLEGFIFLIVIKIFLFLLGIALALFAAFVATIIAVGLSVFVYPFALRKNLKNIA